MNPIARLLLPLPLFISVVSSALAGTAAFTFTDPSLKEGDRVCWSSGDVVQVDLEFDPGNGTYRMRWIAHPALPFLGPLRFRIVVENRDKQEILVLSHDWLSADFRDSVHFSGRSDRFKGWQAADRVRIRPLDGTEPLDLLSGIHSLDPFRPPGIDLLGDPPSQPAAKAMMAGQQP